MDKEELIETVKAHLVSTGWQHDHAELVIDNIVATFDEELFVEGFASYDDIARNSGVANVPPLDEQTIELLNEIKSTD